MTFGLQTLFYSVNLKRIEIGSYALQKVSMLTTNGLPIDCRVNIGVGSAPILTTL